MAVDEGRMRSSIESLATAALYHRDAAIHLIEKFYAQRPEVSGALFPVFMEVAAFELLLLSVEQSLKVLLLLHDPDYSIEGRHDIYKLLTLVERMSKTKSVNVPGRNLFKKLLVGINKERESNIRQRTFDKMRIEKGELKSVDKRELKDIFNRNANAYANFRYLGVNRDLSQNEIGLNARDEAILYMAALALVKISLMKMKQEGMSPYQQKPVQTRKVNGYFLMTMQTDGYCLTYKAKEDKDSRG